jgi:hypothetical protein
VQQLHQLDNSTAKQQVQIYGRLGTPNSDFRIENFEFQTLNFEFQTPNFKFRTPNFELQTSKF